MSIIGNIIWLLFGGILIALEYFISSILLCLTIIGIPFGCKPSNWGFWHSGLSAAKSSTKKTHTAASPF